MIIKGEGWSSDESILRAYLLSNYSNEVRPVINSSTVTYVNITLTVIQIMDLVSLIYINSKSKNKLTYFSLYKIGWAKSSNDHKRTTSLGKYAFKSVTYMILSNLMSCWLLRNGSINIWFGIRMNSIIKHVLYFHQKTFGRQVLLELYFTFHLNRNKYITLYILFRHSLIQ